MTRHEGIARIAEASRHAKRDKLGQALAELGGRRYVEQLQTLQHVCFRGQGVGAIVRQLDHDAFRQRPAGDRRQHLAPIAVAQSCQYTAGSRLDPKQAIRSAVDGLRSQPRLVERPALDDTRTARDHRPALRTRHHAPQCLARQRAAALPFAGALLYRSEPKKFIAEIAKHYATDHKYTDAVLSIMKVHHLEQYDAQ